MSDKFSYPLKVILAWGEAISGNSEIRNWLMKNGYPELGLFCFALVNQEEPRDWLIKNGYPHLLALINGAEGNGKAIDWLGQNGFELLMHIALVGDNNVEAMTWLENHSTEEFQLIAKKIQFVKNRLQAGNSDAHKFNNS